MIICFEVKQCSLKALLYLTTSFCRDNMVNRIKVYLESHQILLQGLLFANPNSRYIRLFEKICLQEQSILLIADISDRQIGETPDAGVLGHGYKPLCRSSLKANYIIDPARTTIIFKISYCLLTLHALLKKLHVQEMLI